MARELPRILTALGPVVATVGVVVYGMAIAYREPRDADVTIGVVLMVGGLVVFLIGLGMMRAGVGGSDELQLEPAEPSTPHQAIHATSGPGGQTARHEGPDEGRTRSRSRSRRR